MTWRADHNDSGVLVLTHQHDVGDPIVAKLERDDQGMRQAVCECGATLPIDGGRSDSATTR